MATKKAKKAPTPKQKAAQDRFKAAAKWAKSNRRAGETIGEAIKRFYSK